MNTDETADHLGLKTEDRADDAFAGNRPGLSQDRRQGLVSRQGDIIAYTNGRRFMGTGLRDES